MYISKKVSKKNKQMNCFIDNRMFKLKAHFFNTFIRNFIKENSINKNIELKKLPSKGFISDLSWKVIKYENSRHSQTATNKY